MMMKAFLTLLMAPSGTLMEYILTEKDLINTADIMMIMMNMYQEKVGMKKIIVIKMKYMRMNLQVIMSQMKKKMMDLKR